MSSPFLGLTCVEVNKAKTGYCQGSHRIPGHESPAYHLETPVVAPAPGFHHWKNASPRGEAPCPRSCPDGRVNLLKKKCSMSRKGSSTALSLRPLETCPLHHLLAATEPEAPRGQDGDHASLYPGTKHKNCPHSEWMRARVCVCVCVCECVCVCVFARTCARVLMRISYRPEMGRSWKSGSKGGRLRSSSLAVNRGSKKPLGEKVSMAAPKWTKGVLPAVRGSGRRLGNWSPPSQTLTLHWKV